MFQTRYPVDWRLAQVELLSASGGSTVSQGRLRDFRPGDVFHLLFSHECLDYVELGCPMGSLLDLNLVHDFPLPLVDDSFLLSVAPHIPSAFAIEH